jgi:hypothetical protein
MSRGKRDNLLALHGRYISVTQGDCVQPETGGGFNQKLRTWFKGFNGCSMAGCVWAVP